MNRKRIWELDALRGVLILLVIGAHGLFDAVYLYRILDWEFPPLYMAITAFGGALFPWMSGISVTLGSHCVKRGLTVFAGGMIITAVTLGMYFLNFADADIIIYFGVLHCLGVCMLCWPLFKKLPVWALASIGTALLLAGIAVRNVRVNTWLLVPLGLVPYGFASSDYFPLMPHLGIFLLGAVLGKTLYASKTTRFPKVNTENPVVRFFCFCGKHSLLVYLIHQPILSLIFWLIANAR